MSFVINDIESYGLYVKVLWVGSFLGSVVKTLSQSDQKAKVLILTWTPSEIIASANFVPVSFPPCKGDRIVSPGCRYEYHRLIKSASLSLRNGAQSAYAVSTTPLRHR